MKGLIALGVVVLVVVGVGGWGVGINNDLVRSEQGVNESWAQVQNVYQRRADLIPNLVETAKAYMAHERQTLEAVVAARGTAMAGLSAAQANPGDPAAMQQLSQGQGVLNTALGRLLAVAEQYPDLKANQNMMQLSEELTSTENRVAFARQAYNDSVMSYNNNRETFPGSVFAGMFGFTAAAQLEIPPEHPEMRDAPKVQF